MSVGILLGDRKQYKECLFTEALETVIEFEDEADKGPTLAERITAMFSSHKKQSTRISVTCIRPSKPWPKK